MLPRLPFQSATAKLWWAKQIIDELQGFIENYDGAQLVPEREGGEVVWKTVFRDDPKETVALLLGDCIHNLRSALEHSAVELVRLNESNFEQVYCPFGTDEDHFEKQIKSKNFYRASPEAVEIWRKAKPYCGGASFLRGIHDLDVHDKHKDLIEVAGNARMIEKIEVSAIPGIGGLVIEGGAYPDTRGRVGAAIRTTNPSVNMKPTKCNLVVTFGEFDPFSRKEIITTLKGCHELVSGIIDSFAALYKG